MKVKSIGEAAAIISCVEAGFLIVAAIVMAHYGLNNAWLILLLIVIACIVAFHVAHNVIGKFVVYKLKPIYQVVLSRDVRTSELEKEFDNKPTMVKSVGDELTSWAEKNRREISRLKETEKYRKEFLGNVSHEIKTPIFNIQGYISTLLDGGMKDETINRKYLENAEKSIDRLINIITDLDEITKLESGVLNLQWEQFDIVELTRDIVDTIEFEATKKHMKIVIGHDSPVPYPPVMVKADKRYIEQVLVNLIINSIRYGNPEGTTRISYIDLFDKIMVEVSDNGIGIAKEDIPRVFERFYRTDKSRSREQGGTGLGLAIVKHILEAHNESITLRSELGKGSTFAFTLIKS